MQNRNVLHPPPTTPVSTYFWIWQYDSSLYVHVASHTLISITYSYVQWQPEGFMLMCDVDFHVFIARPDEVPEWIHNKFGGFHHNQQILFKGEILMICKGP